MLFSVIFVFIKFAPSRYLLVIAYFISLTMLISQRTIFYNLFGNKLAMNGYKKRVLIYGAGDLGRALFRELRNSPKLGILPVGFVDDDVKLRGTECLPSGYNCETGISVLGTGKDIPRLKDEVGFDEVYAAISNVEIEKLQNILETLRACNIKVSFVPNLYQVFLHKIKINKFGDIPIISELDNENNFAYLLVKRYMDIFLALLLLFLLWPFLIVIGCAIRFDSKGPAIFKQKRVGKDGKLFTLYKYRTMVEGTNPYEVNPLDHSDIRITKVGRFLRKMSLDEIPQLINILKGDMAFVGPRPEMSFIVEQYNELHKERLKVLPGITGLWQLSGDRKKAIHENMDYDLYYVRNASFFLDLVIMIETMVFAFKGI
jgi:exopolysaccharide biosynthesis polyprenyl glycosylphosphotransferase